MASVSVLHTIAVILWNVRIWKGPMKYMQLPSILHSLFSAFHFSATPNIGSMNKSVPQLRHRSCFIPNRNHLFTILKTDFRRCRHAFLWK